MTGMRYHRLQQHLTQAALARRAHLSRYRIAQMEAQVPTGTYARYEHVAKVLGVSVNDLLAEIDFGESNLPIEDAKLAPQEDLYNAISHFRVDHGLSFHSLSRLLYCTDEVAKAACLAESSPEEHIEFLARATGLTPKGFLEVYREGELM